MSNSPTNTALDGARHPWLTGWQLVVPFALWLILDKSIKLGTTAFDPALTGRPDNLSPKQLLMWLAFYAWFRLAGAMVAAYVVQRIVFPRRPAMVWALGAAIWVAMAAVFPWLMPAPGRTFSKLLVNGSLSAAQQIGLYLVCIWREFATVAFVALMIGLLFRVSPATLHRPLRWLVMAIVVVLCVLVGADFAYESAVGQAPSMAVLSFAASRWQDMLPLARAEVSAVRLFALVGGPVFAAAWFYRLHRREAPAAGLGRDQRALIAGVAGSLALLAPVLATGVVPLERHAEGTVLAFLKTVASSESREANLRVQTAFESDGRPPWHSIDMSLQPTVGTTPLNVVIIMLESVRADSTTVHGPELPTTPYLAELAKEGVMLEDMSVVYPRTSGAWMAILAGQYPLTIEGAARWTVEHRRQPRIRALPSLLSEQGYATAFFTPTDLNFADEIEVVRSLGFEHIVSDPELQKLGQERTNYLGGADESMIEPILAWTAAQQKAGKPFMTAIMTNVGHHPYSTPATWKKIQFPGVVDERLNDYYNCLLYIDGFLETLMRGYEGLGLRDNTLFIVLGDHGQSFGEHGLRQVYNGLYQEGVHVPAVLYAPGVSRLRGTVRGARQHIDVLPTVIELLGYEARGGRLPGVSLLAPPDAERKMFLSTSMAGSALAARHGTRKYIYRFDRSPLEAFDLASDPKESRPLVVSPDEASAVVREMLEWKAGSELSMYARRDSASATGAVTWSRR